MASAKGKSQLFKFKELPPYPTLLAEEMANHIFIFVCTVWRWLNSLMFLDWQGSLTIISQHVKINMQTIQTEKGNREIKLCFHKRHDQVHVQTKSVEVQVSFNIQT